MLWQSILKGEIVDLEYIPVKLTRNLEPNAITFDLCRDLIPTWMSASEDEIKEAIKLIANTEKQIIEGAAGVSVASFLKMKNELRGKTVVIVLCGGSVNTTVFGEIIKE